MFISDTIKDDGNRSTLRYSRFARMNSKLTATRGESPVDLRSFLNCLCCRPFTKACARSSVGRSD